MFRLTFEYLDFPTEYLFPSFNECFTFTRKLVEENRAMGLSIRSVLIEEKINGIYRERFFTLIVK